MHVSTVVAKLDHAKSGVAVCDVIPESVGDKKVEVEVVEVEDVDVVDVVEVEVVEVEVVDVVDVVEVEVIEFADVVEVIAVEVVEVEVSKVASGGVIGSNCRRQTVDFVILE